MFKLQDKKKEVLKFGPGKINALHRYSKVSQIHLSIIPFSADTFSQTKGIVVLNVVFGFGSFQRAIQIIGIIVFIFIR